MPNYQGVWSLSTQPRVFKQGSIISASAITPSSPLQTASAKGVWSLAEQAVFAGAEDWPVPGLSQVNGFFAGRIDFNGANTIDEIDFVTEGNATDFGDLTVSRGAIGGFSSSTRGVWGGGFTGSAWSNVIDYITMASSGNATDFGDLSSLRASTAGSSNSTRGLFSGGSDATTNTLSLIHI